MDDARAQTSIVNKKQTEGKIMPKMKTKSAAKKRFKTTATGKIKRACSGKNHILTKKSRKRKNNLCDGAYVDATQAKTIQTLIYNK